MRLISVTANKESFREVHFKQRGISIVSAVKSNPDDKTTDKTFNGVGKSLLQNIVSFCLGSNPIGGFEKLGHWEFSLNFSIDNTRYTATRAVNNQRVITLNGEELGIQEYKKLLQDRVLSIPEDIDKGITFRNVLSRFMRVRKESCQKWDTHVKQEGAYQKLLVNGFLLGLDVGIIQRKKTIRDEYKKLETTKRALESDDSFSKFFEKDTDLDIEILDRKERISALELHLENFKVAKDYRDIESHMNQLSQEKTDLNNKQLLLENELRAIEKSLSVKPGLSTDEVVAMYENARVELPKNIVKHVEDVLNFHETLIANRIKRLLKEKRSLTIEHSELEKQLVVLDEEIDKNVEYLGAHGALDEFTNLSKRLGDCKAELEKLEAHKEIVKDVKKRMNEKKIELDQQNQMAIEYAESSQEEWEELRKLFRDFSREFYPDHPGGILIKENTGNNVTQFDIDVKIDYDASDGIGEVKLLCFDLLLLLMKKGHSIDFLFYDSRIFTDIDPRQIADLLKLVDNLAKHYDFQYILSANEDSLHSVKEYLSEKQYDELVVENTVLSLTDESEKTKLLGINIDLDYES